MRAVAGQDARCYLMFRIYSKSGEMRAQLAADPNDRCNWPAAPTPSCRPKDVWARALEQGAPQDGRAYMRYLVRNARSTPATVTLRQDGLWRENAVLKESIAGRRTDSDSFAWDVPVPANGEAILTFTISTSW